LTFSGSEEVSNFRLWPGAGEAAREAGGDGGRVDGKGGGRSVSICYDGCVRWKVVGIRRDMKTNLKTFEELFTSPSPVSEG
jgi:hypothetical protein